MATKSYKTYSAIEIAFSLLRLVREKGHSLTNLQLQKLVYICHGISLAKYDRPLIIEDIHAWEYGPVVPSVYFRFKYSGSDYVSEDLIDVQLDTGSEEIVSAVIDSFSDLDGGLLVQLTHRQGSPWYQTWFPEKQNAIISDEIIKRHYLGVLKTGIANCL